MIDPLIILCVGLVIVLGMILVLRLNAFLALSFAAFAVSFLVGHNKGVTAWNENVLLVTKEFGVMAGKVGFLIIMGAIIGHCMLKSRAADRIILTFCNWFGEKRIPAALLSSGFVLSIPVFYDTTFYLLVPLARSCYQRLRKNYILLLTAIGAGATITHTLVPPTPGPLITANELGLSIASVMLTGSLVGILLAPITLLGCYFVNWYLPNPRIVDRNLLEMVETNTAESKIDTEKELPSLFAALAPIIVPVVFISCASVLSMLESAKIIDVTQNPISHIFRNLVFVFGDANIALLCGAFVAAMVMLRQRKYTITEFSAQIEKAIMDAGMIVLITSAGGAFGAMLRESGVGEKILSLVQTGENIPAVTILLLSFFVAALIKTAQGSSTTAMITTSGIVGAILMGPDGAITASELGFHPAYIATTIGLGSMVTGWMNDSGYWVFCRMGGIHEIDAMKTWSVLLALMGFAGLGIVLVLTKVLPLV